MGRFISADDTAYLGADGTLLSFNLFTYCKNNPVMGSDAAGSFSWHDLFNTAAAATGIAITGVATMGAAATASILESNNKQGKDYIQARNNKQANQWAQEVGYEGAEELKADYVGRDGSKFNMFRNKATKEIILIGIKGVLKGIERATGLFLP